MVGFGVKNKLKAKVLAARMGLRHVARIETRERMSSIKSRLYRGQF